MKHCEQTGGCLRRGICPPSLTNVPSWGEGQAHGGTVDGNKHIRVGVKENVQMAGKDQT